MSCQSCTLNERTAPTDPRCFYSFASFVFHNPDYLLYHSQFKSMILFQCCVPVCVPQRGSAIAGHRGYFLKGPGVQLNLALINYGIAFLMARKYTPLQTPFFMNKEVMAGVAQLSEFDEALYAVHAGDGEKKYLIATSEQPICAYHKDEELNEKKLPIRCVFP